MAIMSPKYLDSFTRVVIAMLSCHFVMDVHSSCCGIVLVRPLPFKTSGVDGIFSDIKWHKMCAIPPKRHLIVLSQSPFLYRSFLRRSMQSF